MTDDSISERFERRFEEIREGLETVGRLTHASEALTQVARIESLLQELIEAILPNLSNNLREKLFTGYGPFASFTAKIDVNFALGKIDEVMRGKLHALRLIRNEFAHSVEHTNFDSPVMIILFRKMAGYKEEMPKFKFFEEFSMRVYQELLNLRDLEKPQASPERSMLESPARPSDHDETDKDEEVPPQSS